MRRAAPGCVTRSSFARGAVVLTAVIVLAVVARADPVAAAVPLAIVGAVLWLLQRLQAAHHRRTRHRQWRRQVGTAALVAAGAWTALTVVRALRDSLADPDPSQAVAPDDDGARWPGAFLVDGLVATVVLTAAASVLGPKRHRRPRGSGGSSGAVAPPHAPSRGAETLAQR